MSTEVISVAIAAIVAVVGLVVWAVRQEGRINTQMVYVQALEKELGLRISVLERNVLEDKHEIREMLTDFRVDLKEIRQRIEKISLFMGRTVIQPGSPD